MTPHPESAPRLLLVEDDPISSGFFRMVLEALPAEVDCCDSKASALMLTAQRHYDLALIDVNLPDGNGSELLAALPQRHLPALAHTAELSPASRNELCDDGFLEVLIKPISAERLLQAVRRGLSQARTAALTANDDEHDWDEHAALLALNGQRGHLQALRELFLAELPATRAAVDAALQGNDLAELRNQLHRLQASCGFVGATRLAGTIKHLRSEPQSPQSRERFHAAVVALLQK